MDMAQGPTLPAWPKLVPAQCVALRAAPAQATPAAPTELAQRFRGVRAAKLAPMLQALVALGQAWKAGAGNYVA
jgi:hypothetical protein